MKKIQSFELDHTTLLPGVYKSRTDYVKGNPVVTYDLRCKLPNREPALAIGAMHTIEHLVATYLRNTLEKDKVIYFGGMMCLTGFYLIMDEVDICKVSNLVVDAFKFVMNFEGDIPGASVEDCGNAALHDLAMAKYEAALYLDRLPSLRVEGV